MDSDEFLDYWEEEGWGDSYIDDPTISLYSLPLIAVGAVSLFLIILLAVFAGGRDLTLPPVAAEQPVTIPEADIALAEPARAEPPGEYIAALFTPSVQYWETEILNWAGDHSLDPDLVATIMQIESCGHPEVVSSAGATGLFQVMPFHFQPGDSPTNPETNAARGLNYLVRSLEAHQGDVYLAFAGYNAGIGGSQRAESAWPQETKRYTYWGSGIYADALSEEMSSGRLAEWLAAGGAGLCTRAEEYLGIGP